MADAQSNIQVNIDTTQALASIKNLQRQIAAFHTSMAKGGAAANAVSAQMQQTLINSINATGQFSAQIKTIRTTTESFTTALEKNKFSLGEYFRYAGGASKTFGRLFKTEFDTINKVARENVKDLQTQYIRMGRDASGAMKAIAVRPLSLDMSDLATRTMIASERQALLNQLLKQGSTNLLNFGKNTQWAGRQLMVGFTLPLIALGSAASKTFMDMETQAIRFKKVYGDLFTPQEESKQALKDIQELGKEFTKYGIAVSTTVSLAAEAAAAGFKGVDLQRQTAAATRLSILGQVESQKALETTIALQNAFSMSSADLATNIDFLNAVENQTVLSLDDVSTAIPKAAPIIQQLGGDVKDLAFFMTAMKEGGINASEGANALKSGLASMINPTGKASAMLEGFGINIKKIVVDNKGDLKKTVIEFATALNMLDPLNRAQAIEQMFGKFQFARLSTLFANVTKEGNQASRVLDLAGASVQNLASLSEKELGMTSESAMNKFKGAVENLKLSLVPLGEEFLKAVTPIAEFITRILDKFNNLSDTTKKIIVTITAVVAGLGPVFLMTFGLLANGLANIIKGFTFLKTLFNKTGQSTATLGTEVRYMTTEQRNAAAVAASLDQVHIKLAQTFTSEASAVNALTQAYMRAIAAQSQFVPVAPPLTRGPIPKRAAGKPAVVGGTGNKDSELALLMPGETVIPTAMSAKYGGLINAMISDRIPGYEVGKPKAGSPSIFGGQSLDYSGLGVFAPGNTSGSALGMSRDFFMQGEEFGRSLTASAVGGGFTLDNPSSRLTATATREYADAVKSYMPRIVEALRSTATEMEATGQNISSMEDVTKQARPKLDRIFSEMTAQGGRAASSAKALKSHLFFPTEAEMGGQFGETRVPGARRSSTGAIKSTMYRIRKSPFQSRVRTAYRNLFGANPEGSYAHMNESRMLGAEVPLRGGALALPESERSPLAARVTAKGRSIREEFFGGIKKRRTPSEQAAIRQSGAEDKREYVKGLDSVDTKDPYLQTRDRKSPHAQAAKDGRDDARAYVVARDKELTQSGRKRRVATRAQGPAPIGATPQPGMTILPIVPPEPKGPAPKPKGILAKMGGKMSSMGGGMGLFGANMALSMAPDFAGKGVVQGGLAGANLGMMFGGYGMAAGAALGLVTTALGALIKKQEEYAASVRSTFTPSTEIISLLGDTALNTELKITNLSTTSTNLKDNLGLLSPEIKAIVDSIAQLPEDNPLAIFVKNISDTQLSLRSLTGSIRSQVTAAISTGGLDPKNAQKYVQALLAAANRTKDFAEVWKSVSKDVVDAQTATTVSLDKLVQANTKAGDSWFTGTQYTGAIAKSYGDLTNIQKILADQMLDLFSITSNGSLTLDQITERVNGLKSSSITAEVGVVALSAAINATKNPDAIARLAQIKTMFTESGNEAAMTADKIMMMNLALQLTTQDAIRDWASASGMRKASPLAQIQAYLKSNVFKDLYKQYNEFVNPNVKDYQEPTDGVDGLSKASEAYLKILAAEIKKLEAKRDAQKSINEETQRQIDLQMKLKDLANQAVFAKISGDYLKAATLQQQAQNIQTEFNLETELRKKDAEIARLKARYDAIKDGAPLTKAEAAKIPKTTKVKKASGGMIRGAGTGTSDSIPAYLSNGEYVVKADSVKKYGVGTFDSLNAQKFKDGGLASRPKYGKKENFFQRYVSKLIKSQEGAKKILGSSPLTSWMSPDAVGGVSLMKQLAGRGTGADKFAAAMLPLNFMGMGIPGKLGLLGHATVAGSAGAKAAAGASKVIKPIFSKMTSSLGKVGAAKMAGKLDEQAALHAAGETVDPIYANKVILDEINTGMMESARQSGRRTPTQMGNAAEQFKDEHVNLTTASLLLGSDLGVSLRSLWGKAFDELVKAGSPVVNGMTKDEFFIKLSKEAPGVMTRYSEDPASMFVQEANQALMKSLGFKSDQAVAMYRSTPYTSGKSAPGYYSMNERFATEYLRQYLHSSSIREFDELTGGLYQADVKPVDFPSPIGFGGFLDEYSAVLGKGVTKGAKRISSEELKGAWKRGFPIDEYFEAKPIVMTDELDKLLTPKALELLPKYPLLSQYDLQKMLPPGQVAGTRVFDFARLEKLWWDKQPLAFGSDPQFEKLDQFIKFLEEYGKSIGQDVLVSKFAKGGLISGPGTGISDSIRASLGYAGGGSIRVSNGEYIVKASSVKDYGVKAMNAINNGTATIGTNSGGTVYNINMPVTSNNANAEGVANEVMRKLKLEVSKNNKTNKVGL